MGRKKSSGAEVIGFGALLLLGFIVKYWEAILTIAVGVGILYVVYKAITKANRQTVSTDASDLKIGPEDLRSMLRIEVTSNSSYKRTSVNESIQFYETSSSVAISGTSIDAYLLYVGESENNYPHLVDPKLRLGKSDKNYQAQMGYWPSYHQISDADRATYIAWLADGRKYPDADIGLVFLYFYGLEYRAIEEEKNHREIFHELIRLYAIYAEKNGSFARYCGQFLAWLCAKNRDWPADAFEKLIDIAKTNWDLQRALGSIFFLPSPSANREEFLVNYAQSVLSLHVPNRMKQVRIEFISLFLEKTQTIELSDDALKSGESFTFTYRSATALRLNPSVSIEQRKLNKPLENNIIVAWTTTEAEIENYAKLNRDESRLQSLFSMSTSSAKDKLKLFLNFQNYKVCSTSELLTVIGADSKLSPTESKRVAEGLQTFGVFIEPDPRLTGKALKLTERVILTKDDLSNCNEEKWKRTIPLFDLAMSVAISEGNIDEKEVLMTLEFVTKQFRLSFNEANRLQHRSILLKDTKASIGPLAKKLASTITLPQGKAIAKFLFSIASLDGKLEPGEVKTLQKAFTAFNFPEDTIDRMIAEFSAVSGGGLVIIKEQKSSSRKGSRIPKQEKAGKPEVTSITLDSKALENAFAEANEVSKLLASVFVIDDEEEPNPTKAEDAQDSSSLSAVEASVLKILADKSSWNLNEVEDVCRGNGLMYGAFLNNVNQWAETKYGSPILEEDGDSLLISEDYKKEAKSA